MTGEAQVKTRCTIPILILGIALSAPLQADIAAANAALSSGDFQSAIKEFTRLADNGDARAQSYLGYMYYAGEGVGRDYRQAVQWYSKAAAQGDRDAQYNLAVAYAFGNGVEQDYAEAVKWYRKAAGQDLAAAQYSLGLSYARGEGVGQDIDAARQWFRKAADQGYADATVALQNLGDTNTAATAPAGSGANDLLAMDDIQPELPGARTPARDKASAPAQPGATAQAAPQRVAQDPAGAATGQQAAASGRAFDNGDKPAAKESIEDEVTPDFKSLDTTVGAAGTSEGLGEAAESGTLGGASGLDSNTGLGGNGSLDRNSGLSGNAGLRGTAAGSAGPGNPSTPKKEGAGSFLKRLFGPRQAGGKSKSGGSSPDNSASAQTQPAAAGDDSSSSAREQTAAVDTNAGDEAHQRGFLSRLFGAGKGGKSATAARSSTGPAVDPAIYRRGMSELQGKNYHDAAAAFHEAATQGDARSQFRLGSLFYQGLGVSLNYSEAARWYQRAAENGNADAQYSLGNMYLMGEGVKQDDQQAAYWYKKAADQGHDGARENLDNLKRIDEQASRPPGVAEGEVPARAPAKKAEKPARKGFFSRLFG